MFWWDGQPKLCALIRKLKEVTRIQDKGRPVVLNLRINCTDITRNNGLGTGNWLVAFYMMRIAASYASVHLKFECSAANYQTEILPYLQGCYAPTIDRWPPFNVTDTLMCGWEMRTAPVHLAALDIKDAMRHLVRTATGFERPPLSVNVTTTMFGEVSFDEVAIHFRCGDILNLPNPRGDYGLIRYSEYQKRIDPSVKSIGLITQSFDKSRNREADQVNTDACRDLANLLVGRFKTDFPEATITIRNDQSETLTLAYVRLAVAEQSIVGLSSFGAFPILANFGTSYFVEGRLLVNKWLNHIPDMMDNLVVIIDPKLLRNKGIMKNGIEFTKRWIVG
jgi:hypothetical protein